MVACAGQFETQKRGNASSPMAAWEKFGVISGGSRRSAVVVQWQVLAEHDGSSFTNQYLYGNYIDKTLLMRNGSTDRYYAHNHLFSTSCLDGNRYTHSQAIVRHTPGQSERLRAAILPLQGNFDERGYITRGVALSYRVC